MALYSFEEGFETGSKGAFDQVTDDATGRLFFPGPRQLANDGWRIAPYRGGGIMQVNFSKSSTDALVKTATGFDVVSPNTMFFRMMVMPYGLNLASPSDVFTIFRGKATAANEYEAKITWHEPEGLVLDLHGNTMALMEDQWNCIEGEVKAGAGGWVKLYVHGVTLAHNPATVASITDFHLGVMAQGGSITQGSICFDEVIAASQTVPPLPARLYPPQGPENAMMLSGASLRMRKSGFAFVGPGEILSVQLVSEVGTNNAVRIYDTGSPTFADDDLIEILTATVEGMTKINQRVLRFNRGAWLEISGTSPLVVMQLGQLGDPGYFSDFMNQVTDEDDAANASYA